MLNFVQGRGCEGKRKKSRNSSFRGSLYFSACVILQEKKSEGNTSIYWDALKSD